MRKLSVVSFVLIVLIQLVLLAISESDYCWVECSSGGDTKHIACARKGQCGKPSENCLNFKNSALTEDEKLLILETHNAIRNRAALGEEDNLKVTASYMNILKWDSELEYIALCYVNDCGQEGSFCFDSNLGKTGINVAFNSTTDKNKDFGGPEMLKTHIESWHSQVHSFSVDQVGSYTDNEKLQKSFGKFTHLIWAKTTSVGCARSLYGQYDTMFACIYHPAGNVVGRSVFRKGTPCSGCKVPGSCTKEYPGLCSGPAIEKRTSISPISTLAHTEVDTAVIAEPESMITKNASYRNVWVDDVLEEEDIEEDLYPDLSRRHIEVEKTAYNKSPDSFTDQSETKSSGNIFFVCTLIIFLGAILNF